MQPNELQRNKAHLMDRTPDKYSYELKRRLAEYEELISESKPSDGHQNRLLDLERYFDAVPKQFGPELAVRLQQIQLARLNGAK